MKLRFQIIWIILIIAASFPLSIRLLFFLKTGYWKFFDWLIDIPWIILLIIITSLLYFAETKPSFWEAIGIVFLAITSWIFGIIILFLLTILPMM